MHVVAGTYVHVTVAVMALGIDEQVLAEMAPLLAALGEVEPPPVGDVESRRVNGHRMFDLVAAKRSPAAACEPRNTL